MIESITEKVNKYLQSMPEKFAPVLEIPLTDENVAVIDLSKNNPSIKDIDITNVSGFSNYIHEVIKKQGAKVGVGGYLENRAFYSQYENFNGTDSRTIHLGIDLWANPQTIVYAPLNGWIHSFKNNEGTGNYGPTILVEHHFDNCKFFTLYGHLTIGSLSGLRNNMAIKKGEIIGKIGDDAINGGWPSHLHFQIITDLLGNVGDFPGVAAPATLEKYKRLCPDPNHILRIKKLNQHYI